MTSLCACGQKNDLLQAPDVDDVADQVERFGLDRAQEVEQVRGAAAPESQVDVGDEDRAKPEGRLGWASGSCALRTCALTWRAGSRRGDDGDVTGSGKILLRPVGLRRTAAIDGLDISNDI